MRAVSAVCVYSLPRTHLVSVSVGVCSLMLYNLARRCVSSYVHTLVVGECVLMNFVQVCEAIVPHSHIRTSWWVYMCVCMRV